MEQSITVSTRNSKVLNTLLPSKYLKDLILNADCVKYMILHKILYTKVQEVRNKATKIELYGDSKQKVLQVHMSDIRKEHSRSEQCCTFLMD